MLAPALYLLAFGSLMLCCSSNQPDRIRWVTERVVFGGGAAAVATVAFVLIYRWLRRSFNRLQLCPVVIALILPAAFLDVWLWKRLPTADDRIARRWKPNSIYFDWGLGRVRIPDGFRYERLLGIDTFMGRFLSPDGHVAIEYDIGELAAEHGSAIGNETLIPFPSLLS